MHVHWLACDREGEDEPATKSVMVNLSMGR